MSEYTPRTEDILYAYREDTAGIGRLEHREAGFYRWLNKIKAEVWDECNNATKVYLGPDSGHYEDCMGWEDCYCGTYINPYRTDD